MKDKRVIVRLNGSFYAELQKFALEHGETMSESVRRLLEKGLAKEKNDKTFSEDLDETKAIFKKMIGRS